MIVMILLILNFMHNMLLKVNEFRSHIDSYFQIFRYLNFEFIINIFRAFTLIPIYIFIIINLKLNVILIHF